MRRLAVSFTLLALVPATLPSQAADTAYSRLVREATSDPRFLPASVAGVPDHATVPSPRDHFGTIAGAPGVMHRSAELYGYYRALAAATPRVRVETVGRTEEGRELILVIVADDSAMTRLGENRDLLARLADPRTLPESDLPAVLDRARPVYHLIGGLHSPEMGSPEMLTELVYRLAVSDDPAVRAIRERVITLVNPVAEPDGRDRQVDWYLRYTRRRTVWDDGFPRSAPYWGRYVYHDNNRDGLQLTQALTQASYRTYFAWHPTVMHDLHESVPLLYASTGTGPYNEQVDPITVGEWWSLAQHDLTTLTAQGLPGVWTWGFYDGWWPGYLMWAAVNHNGIGRFYETFGNAGANTFERDLSESRFAGDSVTSREWYRPWPPSRRVRWSARDNVNYMQAGVLASLGYVSQHGRELLENFWRKGRNAVARGRGEAPYAFVIPDLVRQRDPRRAAYLVNQLRRHGIEVHRRTEGDSAGDFVVRLDQPYRGFAITLLTRQRFPVNDPNTPYDDVAWTLGLLYGADVRTINDSAALRWPIAAVTDTVASAAAVRGTGARHVLAYRAQAELLPALVWLRTRAPRATAVAIETTFVAGSDTFPRGSVVFEGLPGAAAAELAERFALPVVGTDAAVPAARHALDLPRLAVYHTWYSTQDEGWVRFTLERAGIPYTSIHKDDLRAGGLRRRFDVILVPNAGGSVETWIHEIDRRWSPLPYTETSEFPSHGSPSSTADMTGGPGFQGLAELQRFVEDGGTLVTLFGGTRLAAETGIARPLSALAATGLFHPGSIVRAKARRADHPVLYGYPDTVHLFRGNGPLYQVPRRDRGMMVLQFGTEPLPDERPDTSSAPMFGIPPAPRPPADSGATPRRAATPPYVLSGGVRNPDQIVGQGAVFDIPVGRGRVIAFAFNPLHRYLNHHEFPMVWNAIMNWNDLRPPS